MEEREATRINRSATGKREEDETGTQVAKRRKNRKTERQQEGTIM